MVPGVLPGLTAALSGFFTAPGARVREVLVLYRQDHSKSLIRNDISLQPSIGTGVAFVQLHLLELI
jgi:hypothetical protein